MQSGKRSTRERSGAGVFVALVAALCAMLAQSAVAQDELNVVVPQSRVIAPPTITAGVEVRSIETTIEIEGQLATTTMRITLANPGAGMQRAQLVMPVPSDAMIRFFQLEGLGGDGGARLLPREEAKKIYEAIVRSMQDPALLEYLGTGVIQSDVFPVPAGGTQTIVLTYEELLAKNASRVDYLLPRSEALFGGGTAWSIDVTIKDLPAGSAVYSSSHELKIDDVAGRKVLEVMNPDAPGAFRMSVITPGEDGVSATLLRYPDPENAGAGYFTFIASIPQPEGAPKILREVTIVIDRSGSMRGEKIEQAKSAALQIIEALDEGERFNIIDYSTDVERFSDAPVVKNDAMIAEARKYLANIKAIGGTNIGEALKAALTQDPSDGMLPMVLFLTDGLPTVGEQREGALIAMASELNTHRRRVFSFGVGYDVNAPLLTTISTDSRAASEFVTPDEDVEVKVGRVFEKLAGPVLAGPKVTLGMPVEIVGSLFRDIAPGNIPDVFSGEQLVLTGRYLATADSMNVTLNGKTAAGDKSFSFSFPMNDSTESGRYVARLWATRQIAQLIDQIRRSGADGSMAAPQKELVDEIVRLSVEFGVLTEYTAFLADEDGVVAGRDVADRLGILEEATRNLARGRRERSGETSVGQSLANNDRAQARLGVAPASAPEESMMLYLDSDMAEAEVIELERQLSDNVKRLDNDTLYKKAGRWCSFDLIETPTIDPDETVEFASERYFALAGELAADGRNSVLANRGELLFTHRSMTILVKNPG